MRVFMGYEHMVSDDYLFWLLYSDRFFHAAKKLEEVVRKAEKNWTKEMAKLNLQPGVWKISKPTKRRRNAEMDRYCHHVYPYLYCHSLELLLKGLARAFSIELPKKSHSLNKVFNELKTCIGPFPFEIRKIEKMLSQLDGISWWATRYPYPILDEKKGDTLDRSAEHLTLDYEGKGYPSNNIGLIFDQYKEIFMQLRAHIIEHENVKKVLPKSYK